LKGQLGNMLKTAESELRDLPESLAENPQAELLKLCNKFIRDVEDYASGKSSENPRQRTFIRDSSPHYRSLKDQILSTRPHFKVCDRNEKFPNLVETSPTPPSLQPASLPLENHTEAERISSKMLHLRASNQGIYPALSVLLMNRNISGICEKCH
jgi:hypothetical protein